MGIVMLSVTYSIKRTKVNDTNQVSLLCDNVFGPGRFSKTAFRIRENYKGHDDYGFCAWSGEQLIGAIHFTPILIGQIPSGYLLGPLVVSPSYSGQRLGLKLIDHGINQALSDKAQLILLVGDYAYYNKVGFEIVPRHKLKFPGPVDPSRLLFKELQRDSLQALSGLVQAAE